MRALLATAGLLVLAGSAAAGSPTPRTLARNPSGPIEAIAQDGGSVAWLASGGQKCNAVHVLRGDAEVVYSDASEGGMTCRWDLSNGPSQLALATRAGMMLWTLHESGPSPFDDVLASPYGGPERQLDRLAHASDGTGDQLGGVAGAGKTLAYSWVDVEYVDKLACLSGGSCKQKIANGGIDIVTRTGDQPLPGAPPALQLAASAGRIAYIPAMIARSGRPSATVDSSVSIVDAATGSPLGHAPVHGIPAAIALSPHVLAVLTQHGPRDKLVWFSAVDETKLGSVLVSRRAATQIAVNDQLAVYRVDRTLYGVSTATGHVQVLARAAQDVFGFSLAKGQLVWVENHGGAGRLRTLALP